MENSNSAQSVDPYVVSIIDLDFHYDSVDGLIRIFQDHVQKVHVFTTKANLKILAEMTYSPNVVFHLYNSFSRFVFLLKNRSLLKNSDLIFINTIAKNFGAYLAVPGSDKTVLRIHNINKQFIPFKSVVYPKDLFTAWKFSSYVGREIVLKLFPLFRIWINHRIKHFTFPDNGLKNYVISKGYLPPEKVMESIPLKVFAAETEIPVFENELVISIIGATDSTRRRYEEVVEAMREIYREHSPHIRLVLLGRLKGQYGEWILKSLNEIKAPGFVLQHYDINVPEDEFTSVMNRTHLVISPVIQETKTDIFREYYGKTKTSGSILDFIKFGIVTITPDYYSPPAEMLPYFHKYGNAGDLAQKILYFYENPEVMNTLSKESRNFASAHYNLEKIYRQCKQSLKSILGRNDQKH